MGHGTLDRAEQGGNLTPISDEDSVQPNSEPIFALSFNYQAGRGSSESITQRLDSVEGALSDENLLKTNDMLKLTCIK